MEKEVIDLGDKVKDIVSGFTGVVLSVTKYATGCITYGVSSTKLSVKKTPDDSWVHLESDRFKVIKKQIIKFKYVEGTTSHDILKNSKFDLGDKVKDKVTGFEGIVVGKTVYTTRCIHYAIQPIKLDEKNKPEDWQFFDTVRLELLNAGEVKFDYIILSPSSEDKINPPTKN